jgi:hypothetical protein
VSGGERASWLIVAVLCLFFGDRFGGHRARLALEESSQHASQVHSAQLSQAQAQAQLQTQTQPQSELSSSTPHSTQHECAPVAPPVCPPCECPCERKPKPKPKRGRALPPPKQLTPLERARLLAWVRAHSDTLKRCRDAGQPIYRLHASLTLKRDASGVKGVRLKGGEEVPQSALRCLRAAILRWPPPQDLSPADHPTLVFSLQLD